MKETNAHRNHLNAQLKTASLDYQPFKSSAPISQEGAQLLLGAAKEAVVHLLEMKSMNGFVFNGDLSLTLLREAIIKAETPATKL